MLHDRALARVPGSPDSLAEVVQEYRKAHDVRDLATKLADERKPHHLLPLFHRVPVRRDPWAELLACLVQELLLRGVRLVHRPAVAECLASLRSLDHPLALLPAGLTAAERQASARPWLPTPPLATGDASHPSDRASHRNVVTFEQAEAIGSAVKHWNGIPKVLVLQGAGPLGVADVSPVGVNRYLPEGQKVRSGETVALCDAYATLLRAARSDGSYEGGMGRAYGRLAVWRTIAGLIGAPPGSSAVRVNELAGRWQWFRFEQDFGEYWIQYELAIGALSPRGSRLSLLLSHDTD